MGRYQKYFCEDDKHNAIRRSKTKYMLNKSWICPVCEHDYKLAGKWSHMKTKKHIKNTVLDSLKDHFDNDDNDM